MAKLFQAAAVFGLWAFGSMLAAASPEWASSFHSAARGAVVSCRANPSGDVVCVWGGLSQGFRPGMRCLVLQGEEAVAELVVVASANDRCAALVLSAQAPLQRGQAVRIQTNKKTL